LIIGVGGLIVAGPSALYVPHFATLVDKGDGKGFARLLGRTLSVVGALGVMAIGLLYGWSEEIVGLLFRRGAFEQSDVVMVATLLRLMAPGAVAMIAVVVLMRAIFCLKRAEAVAAMMGLSWFALYFGCSGLLHGQGVFGIARSYSIAWVIVAVFVGGYVFYRTTLMRSIVCHDRTTE
jgi:putative peptidoglycan lipid II flippase